MSTTTNSTIRILEVVGSMNHGGVEAWLINTLKHIDRDQFKVDFLVHTGGAHQYNDAIRELGSRTIVCPGPSRPLTYVMQLRQLLRAHGPYHVIHSHLHFFSGLIMHVGKREGIPVRVTHSHLDSSVKDQNATLSRRLYLRMMRKSIAHYATHGLGCSKQAMASLFGPSWAADPKSGLLYCGIDIEPIQADADPQRIRNSLGIPAGSFVAGHVGRFEDQKNHDFLLEIAAEMVRIEPTMRLVLVGDGPLHARIRRRAKLLGIEMNIIFTGTRTDVAQLMKAAFDVFLFPSLYEGLGLVLIEAQAANLPCVISDSIPEEANVIDRLIRRVGLNQSAYQWARTAIEVANQQDRSSGYDQALATIRDSQFNITYSAEQLAYFYRNAVLTS